MTRKWDTKKAMGRRSAVREGGCLELENTGQEGITQMIHPFVFLENSLGLRNLFNTDLYHLHGSNLGIHLTAIMDSTTGL